ncbi:uncharacterized protein THITE_2090199 [Thermothielavioides terrestris NRRL 8126]|uniref:Uncharacterized protein n=1 Tax=Thermothielavioides terrestris (strain ATCC 38088 / NRRL 8126) TaxID=578455 RepID=G2R9E2_THETT|nr:uncharacterized protein THITE_2090199 [Thermothielavioides terrestris NRRL 8126]AEO68683.1 hypothetical protein THITE_2090199 [Thermothielavioides terrestris NRRL 8126]
MRVAAFLVTLFAALVAAAPEMTLEKIRERDLCDCNEVRLPDWSATREGNGGQTDERHTGESIHGTYQVLRLKLTLGIQVAIYAPDLALAVALSISTHGREILDGLEYIKRHKTPPQELLDQTPSPRPANARLPAGWRDKEVAQFDPRRQQGRVAPPVAASAAMDYDTGASSFATGQDEHGLQNEQRLTRALDCQRAGSKEMIRKDVEVRVTRIPHTFHKDELRFERNGRIQSSTEDDWAKGKRDSRTVWFYRHGKKTVYWTK